MAELIKSSTIQSSIERPKIVAGRLSSIGSVTGNISMAPGKDSELFWAIYDSTAYERIETEYTSGKQILVRYLDYICALTIRENDKFIFQSICKEDGLDSFSIISLLCTESGWEDSIQPISSNSVFWATISITEYSELQRAFQDNKYIIAQNQLGDIFELYSYSENSFRFFALTKSISSEDKISVKYIECTSLGWANEQTCELTNDYSKLNNLPSINGVELVGDLTSSELDLASSAEALPTGGNEGDILMKTSNGDYNVAWIPPANSAEKDNTRPITAAAVYTEIGNINALLATI